MTVLVAFLYTVCYIYLGVFIPVVLYGKASCYRLEYQVNGTVFMLPALMYMCPCFPLQAYISSISVLNKLLSFRNCINIYSLHIDRSMYNEQKHSIL